MDNEKQAIIDALRAFIEQRPGFEFANYGSMTSYRQDQRFAQRQLHDARTLLRDIELRDSISADDILKECGGGRLRIQILDTWSIVNVGHRGRREGATTGFHTKEDALARLKLWKDSNAPAAVGAVIEAPRGGARIDYCTGQYFCTEFRGAVARLCASVLWAWTRGHCMPVPHTIKDVHGFDSQRYGVADLSAGDWLRAHFKRQFGKSLASRYFN